MMTPSSQRRGIWRAVCLAAASILVGLTALSQGAAAIPAACPPAPMEVVRSRGGVIDYFGTVTGIPELCRMVRSDGAGDFYYGVWRSDWPGAGQAYPVIRAVVTGQKGTRLSFTTRSAPGLQWTDSFTNEGVEPLDVAGTHFQALRLAHEREGIEGNTYHSIITIWRDVASGVALKMAEHQISGQSYGPDATWTAVQVRPLP